MKNWIRIVVATFCITSIGAWAQYPNRTVRIIVPLAAGGNVDLIARALAEPLSKALGQQVIVENRPGAAALVGTQLVAKAAPDGYTLLAHANTFVSAAVINATPGYDPVKDFAGISLTCKIPMVMVVHPGLPAQTAQEFIALLKSKPGEIAYATSGNGSTGHIAAELFSRSAGVKMLHVPYKGNSQSLVDVMAGQVPMMFDQVSTSIQHIASGKLRPLAVTTMTRSVSLPNVPTLDEAGLKGFEDSTWNGLFAPAGTPPEILARLQQEVAKIVRSPDLHKRFGERGIEMVASNSATEFTDYVRSEMGRYVKLAREANIKAD